MLAEDPSRRRRFLALAALAFGAVALYVAWPLKGPLAFALVVAYLLQRPHAWLSRTVRKPWLSATLLVLGAALAVVLPFALGGALLVREAQSALAGGLDVDSVKAGLVDLASRLGVPRDVAQDALDRGVERLRSGLQGYVTTAAAAVAAFLVDFLIFLLLLYFLLVSWTRLRGFVAGVLPFDREDREELFARSGERVKALVLGSLAIAAIQGSLAALGWWVLGLPNPLLWGLLMFLLELVPLMGAFVILLPAAGWSALQGDWVAAVGLLVLNFLAVGLIDDWLRAWLIGRWSHIPPGLVLVGVVGGISTMGLPGILIGPLLLGLLPLVLRAWSGQTRPFAKRQEEGDAG